MVLGFVSLVASCSGAIGDAPPKKPGEPGEAPPRPCVPALVLAADTDIVTSRGALTVRARGGTGAYRYAMATNVSGAWLSSTTGAYVAGDRGGVVDELAVTDAGCDDIATFHVRVAAPLVASPAQPRLRPRQAITFEVSGGSGNVRASLVTNGTGASATGLAYAAGAGEGHDIMRFEDLTLGSIVEVDVSVSAQHAFGVEPPAMMLPAQAWMGLGTRGGSGVLDVTVQGDAVDYEGGNVRALQPGTARLVVTDHFTRESTTVAVEVVTARDMPRQRTGQYFLSASAVGLGDIDGDGLADFAIGYPETSTANGATSGAVYVYRGRPTTPELLLMLPGPSRDAHFGISVTAGDLDGDGHIDLVAGAPQARVGANVNGAVFVYRGEGGSFATTPLVIAGRSSGDLMGNAVGVCDLNGDGAMDLVVGAFGYEDQTGPAFDQGAVLTYVSEDGELPAAPTTVSLGVERSPEGTARGVARMTLGAALAVGDFSGDGLCDVAAHAPNWSDSPVDAPSKGLVEVFVGVPPSGTTRGGLSTLPRWIITGSESVGLFGRTLAAGDLDGDGRSELVLASSHEDGNGPDSGVVRAFALDGTVPLTLVPSASAFWRIDGVSAFSYTGWGTSVADVTGDGLDDIIVAAPLSDYSYADGGAVTIYPGVSGGIPPVAPSRRINGPEVSSWFGVAVAGVGDADGDGIRDSVAVAATSDGLGLDVGQPFFLGASATRGLAMPGEPGGDGFGKTLAWVDADHDGDDDLVVGAPRAGITWEGTVTNLTGALQVTLADGGRLGTTSSVLGSTFASLFPGDALGTALAGGGDVDGDGFRDLVAVASLGDGIPNGDAACSAAYSGNIGTAYVFTSRLVDGTPDFMIHGRQPGLPITSAAIDVDMNGDGKNDIALAGRFNTGVGGLQTGGVDIVLGRTRTAAAPQRVCDVALRIEGVKQFDHLGSSLVGLGDVNGDGCGELAIGAEFADADRGDQGLVYVVYGWGGTGCAAQPKWIGFRVIGAAAGQLGHALAASDVDGDGRRDLLIGEPAHLVEDEARGAVWVLKSSAIAGAAATAVSITAATQPPLLTLGDPGTLVGRLDGNVSQGRFGAAIAASGPRIIVGTELAFDASDEAVLRGGAQVFDFSAGRFNRTSVFGGEPARAVNFLGEAVGVTMLGGQTWIAVGGSFAGGLDCGAVYTAPVH